MRIQAAFRIRPIGSTAVLALVAVLDSSCSPKVPVDRILADYQERGPYLELRILAPQNETVFPPDIVPCAFSWKDTAPAANSWVLVLEFGPPGARLTFEAQKPEWTPDPSTWEKIKQCSAEHSAKLIVLGLDRRAPRKVLSQGQAVFSTSKDKVAAPIFYREVNLPFMEAVKDPTRIRWRFGSIDSPQPPAVVLEHLPVCGNCHSFSADGKVLGMDVDYANDKGSYVLTRVAREMALASSDIFTWGDFRREDRQQTFGLLSQVSPDGQTVVSTVKDKSVFVDRPELAFSQLFFPIKGILVLYHKNTGMFATLPGADDPQYVQSNPTWSPDGQYIVFARTTAYELKSRSAQGKVLLSQEDCAEFLRDGKPFKFDLYRVPYNGGRGGVAEPIPGASRNGRSNYFPKYSPDGKWIVFCQASNYMLLQPDSELHIIPAEGGEPRRLRANTTRMNSWHSWSPNGRWLVFSSKANSPYTQLFLTHIDERGESTPPVVLANFTAPDRAANIPEFVNAAPGAIAKIREQFLDDMSHSRVAYVFEVNGRVEDAITEYQKALAINPNNGRVHQRLGFLLFNARRQFQEGMAHTLEALRLDPNDGCAHHDLGMALKYQGQVEPAVQHLREAVRLLPDGFDRRYSAASMRCSLGDALLSDAKLEEAVTVLTQALKLEPQHPRAHYLLALATAAQGLTDEALVHYNLARKQQPDVDTSPELHLFLAGNLSKMGRGREALTSAERALELARARGDAKLAQAAAEQVAECRQNLKPN